jgi:hypothetical protein
MSRQTIKALIGLAVATLLAGCAEKLTFQRYEMIHDGQAKSEVRKTLGDPLEDTGGTFVYYDEDRQIHCFVYFNEKGEVIEKQWQSPKEGAHGKDPHVGKPGDAHEIKVRKIE